MSAIASSVDHSFTVPTSQPLPSDDGAHTLPIFAALAQHDTLYSPPILMDADTQMEMEASMSPPRMPAASGGAVNRVNQACASCRRKKVRCDGGQPYCNNCSSRGIKCTYLAQKKRGRPPKTQTRRSVGPYSIATYADSGGPHGLLPGSASQVWQQQQPDTFADTGAGNQQETPPPTTYFSHWPAQADGQGGYGAVDPLAFGSSGPPTSSFFPPQSHAYAAGSSDLSLLYGSQIMASDAGRQLFPMGADGGSSDEFGGQPSFLSAGLQLTPAADHSQPLASPLAPGQMLAQSVSSFQPSAGASAGIHSQAAAAAAVAAAAATVPGQLPLQSPHAGVYQLSQSAADSGSFGPASVSAHAALFSGNIGSAATEAQGSDYFEAYTVPTQPAPPRTGAGSLDLQGTGAFFASGPQSAGGAGALGVSPAPAVHALSAASAGSVAAFMAGGAGAGVSPSYLPAGRAGSFGQFQPLTAPPPMPPLLQQRAQAETRANPDLSTVVSHTPQESAGGALSSSLGSVAMAMARNGRDAASVKTELDHLSHVARNISHAKYDELVQAKETAAAAAADMDERDAEPQLPEPQLNAPIHESLLRIELRAELASRAVHNYFCYIHQQCPIVHKPTFLRQIGDGSVNRFVWLSLRALAARTLLHSHALTTAQVLVEEEYFAVKARAALSDELKKPSVDVVQGLALLSLYIFGTPRWQEASMYWSQATRLAQLMDFHVIDAPSGAIATKMHFGIFEPPKQGPTHKTDLALIPGDFAGDYVPLAQALTPLEAELRRRLWWVLFTNERFCAVAERLPTMVNEARMFVHFPCSARDWDRPEFTYRAPERVPRYQREGYMRVDLGSSMSDLTLGQELRRRKHDNLYMASEIEYGFSMSHLVAFLADMGALFRLRSPYGTDYTPLYMEMPWQAKMKLLRANVERVERIFEMVRQDILHALADAPQKPAHTGPIAHAGGDPVLDPDARVPGFEIPQLHHLTMLILYSALNIHLYRMVFQIHYEFSSSLPAAADRRAEDAELLAAFGQYVKELWTRTTTAAQQVSRILRGDFPGVPGWVLTLVDIRPSVVRNSTATAPHKDEAPAAAEAPPAASEPQGGSTREQSARRVRAVFRERIKAQESRVHEMAHSVLASFRRTLPYAILLVAKVHLDNITSGAGHLSGDDIARSYLDLADAVQFLEGHQQLFSSADYVSLVQGMMHPEMTKFFKYAK